MNGIAMRRFVLELESINKEAFVGKLLSKARTGISQIVKKPGVASKAKMPKMPGAAPKMPGAAPAMPGAMSGAHEMGEASVRGASGAEAKMMQAATNPGVTPQSMTSVKARDAAQEAVKAKELASARVTQRRKFFADAEALKARHMASGTGIYGQMKPIGQGLVNPRTGLEVRASIRPEFMTPELRSTMAKFASLSAG
jgi:hypothetical protein